MSWIVGRRLTAATAALAALVLLLGVESAAARYGPAQRVGTITSPAISEVSGLVASRTLRGGWWVVNDSGNTPQLHAVDARGRLRASVTVAGAQNRDWEDLAAGPLPGGRRGLYIADIGDNDLVRDDLVVYRVREPGVDARTTARAEAFPFRYPDGHHDAEALAVDPRPNGRISIVTKGVRAGVYRFPLLLRAGRRVVLQRLRGRVAEIESLALVTGAAVAPDGSRFAIRTYLEAFEFASGRKGLFEAGFVPVERLLLPLERQGESIAYTPDGQALVTTSEQPPAPLWRLPRRR
ncbi:MAG TPA: hypothetical protein VJ689_01100 [Gaiellaceae bacterium]|nr:hypothetical protein [Gaiellaceae bacterium]